MRLLLCCLCVLTTSVSAIDVLVKCEPKKEKCKKCTIWTDGSAEFYVQQGKKPRKGLVRKKSTKPVPCKVMKVGMGLRLVGNEVDPTVPLTDFDIATPPMNSAGPMNTVSD